MKKIIPKQDRNGVRTATDLDRRYNFVETEQVAEEAIETASSAINELEYKVDKVEGMGLSHNDFTDSYKQDVDDNTTARHTHTNLTTLEGITDNDISNWNNADTNSHTHNNKNTLDNITSTDVSNWNTASANSHTHSNITELDGITSTNISDWDTAKTRTDATSYNLLDYKVSALSILRSSCIVKNNRVVVNFVGSINMAANTTTTLFNLPEELWPTYTKDFILFGSTSNNDGYIGYGYLTNVGEIQVRFAQAISSYIRFSFVYDLD